MRRDPIAIGDFVHVFNRGNRKMPIIHDEADKWRFLKTLRYFNNKYSIDNVFRRIENEVKLKKCNYFEYPKNWPSPKPLVKILTYCLMPNHFHLFLKEINNGGISEFMKKFGGFTKYINTKYNEVGSLFQGKYKRKIVKTEKMLWHTDAYIQVFNPFELYPGGLEKATKEFDKAFKFALEYPFCSLGESFGKRNLHIIDRDVLGEIWSSLIEYKEFAQEAIIYHNNSIRNINKVEKIIEMCGRPTSTARKQ